jgi:hypothetical protein
MQNNPMAPHQHGQPTAAVAKLPASNRLHTADAQAGSGKEHWATLTTLPNSTPLLLPLATALNSSQMRHIQDGPARTPLPAKTTLITTTTLRPLIATSRCTAQTSCTLQRNELTAHPSATPGFPYTQEHIRAPQQQ